MRVLVEELDAFGTIGIGVQVLEAGFAHQAAGDAAQHRDDGAGSLVAHPVTVFEPGAVLDVMQPVFDSPMFPDEPPKPIRTGAVTG